MAEETHEDLRALDSHIGPALTPFGFAAAQVHVEQTSGSAIYCAALEDIHAQQPRLPDGRGEPTQFGECYDVTVHVAKGHLLYVDTDGGDLIDMLLDQGFPSHAQAVREAYGAPAQEAANPVAEALHALFAPRGTL